MVLVIGMSNCDCIDLSSIYSSMIYSNKSIISINLYINNIKNRLVTDTKNIAQPNSPIFKPSAKLGFLDISSLR